MTNIDRYFYTDVPKERGFVVGVDIRTHHLKQGGTLTIEDSLEELAALCDTAGIEVLGGAIQRLNKPNPGTLIGSGKLEELKAYKEELEIEVFVFDDELSPRQLRGVEKFLDVKVLDRTALILDIFARHARTREGQLQVELAQLQYRLPRLTRMWTHLARQAGGRAGGASGGVGVRGPGETQLEVDRREINRKIAHLKDTLDNVRAHRSRHRARRRQSSVPVVAIVGYTNAGKSTLLNALIEEAGVSQDNTPIYAADQLFATLDPTTRNIRLPSGKEVLFSDTVGFIQKLPTELVAAFRATLEEVVEADLLLHVVDITHANAFEQAQVVQETLELIEATAAPMVMALNKIDALETLTEDGDVLPASTTAVIEPVSVQQSQYPDSVMVSAKTGQGLPELLAFIETHIEDTLVALEAHIPYSEGHLVALLHEQATVENETYDETGTLITARIPKNLVGRFSKLSKSILSTRPTWF